MDRCNKFPKICIVGAGFSGMCAAIKLQKELNLESFTIFDENHEVGGTWLVNTYPGCGCDVPSHLYCFSFERNPNWNKAYSGQQEIWEYMKNIAKKHDLYPKIKFLHKVISYEWDDTVQKWHVTVLNKKNDVKTRHIFDIVISGTGGLRFPNCPDQFQPFAGEKMHSAEWNSSIELKDKVVAVVGNGSSAVQIIPAIVDKVKRLIVYQRSAAWVVPKLQMEFSSIAKWTFDKVPGTQVALRKLIFWTLDLTHSAFKMDSLRSKIAVKYAQFQLNRQIRDPELKRKLTPNYNFGCKRVTPSNKYYPALTKPNVSLITSKITNVTHDTIVNEDGTVEKPDVLILATGFKIQEYFAPITITDKSGDDLLQKWKDSGPRLYAGIICPTTPNLFFILGPNTAVGHSSVLFPIECQVNFMIKAIREMMKRNAGTISVKESAVDKYMTRLLNNMKSTVWGATKCGSWFVDHRGVVYVLWPKKLSSYYKATKSVNFSHFEFS